MDVIDVFESDLSGSTIKILDRYIESKEQNFYIKDSFNIKYKECVYSINFIISNKIELGKQIIKTNITMTEFKKIYGDFFCNCEKIINYKETILPFDRTSVPKFSVPVLDFIEFFYNDFKKHFDDGNIVDKEIYFDNPISINAQSSNNRIGYGNQYFYDTLVYEGTKYGETSQFPIIGYKVTFLGKIIDNHITCIDEDNNSMWIRYIPSYLL